MTPRQHRAGYCEAAGGRERAATRVTLPGDGEATAGCPEKAKRGPEPGPDGLPSKPLESIETVVDSEADGNPAPGEAKTRNLGPLDSSGYEAKTTPPSLTSGKLSQPGPKQSRSPRRRRTEKAAIKTLDRELKLSPEERARAIRRIRRSKQPNSEVRRSVEAIRRQRFQTEEQGPVDFSDVQELLVRLSRRDGCVYSPQSQMLRKLDEHIAIRDMTRREFMACAARILALPQALPKGFLARERAYQVDGR